jgi:septal ring factor EnvC (AmiA/AmiB activator)
LLALALLRVFAAAEAQSPEERLDALRRDIARLRREAFALAGREQGLLGELTKLDTDHALKSAELAEVGARLERTGQALAQGAARLEALQATRSDRARYLGFRLREIYKRGQSGPLRRVMVGEDGARLLRGLHYGALLSQRDARELRAFRQHTVEVAGQRRRLLAEQGELAGLHAELATATAALARTRARQARFLDDVRRDRRKKETALTELEAASRDLSRLLEGEGGATVSVDPRTLRGLLEWPFEGRVTARFGRTVDPRFGTAVPHPGLDLEAAAGTPFRAVLEGKVLWSGPLRGYGLTVIVDHGGGLASVYAHAAGLVVEKGEQVARGQTLGHLGETGGERAPSLYFELREGGKPVDPERWLRARP